MFVGAVINSNVKRLYRATNTADGFSASKFHSLCDHKGPTLTIIKTVAGHTFGGYTRISWDKSVIFDWDKSVTSKADYHSFVFTVDKKVKYSIVDFVNAI